MLHLRLNTPADCTDAVLALLHQDPAVVTLSVLRGSALLPPGDLVLVDVVREQASRVLAALRPFDLEGRGAIAVQTVDVALSDLARDARGAPADAVVWEEVTARTSEESELSGSYLALIVAATLIAAVAIVLDSPVLVVGAMVVGPEFGPLTGLAVALVTRRRPEALRSLRALLVGFAVAIGLTLLAVLLARATGLLPRDLDASQRPLTAFISRPDALTVVVAAVAGMAGVVSLTSAKSSALIGVLVSVTTVPAAAGIAVGAATGDRADLLGSSGQLLLNLSVLLLATTGTLVLLRRLQRTREAVGE